MSQTALSENPPGIVLGSGSPRRAELLKSLGLPFEVISSDVSEDMVDGFRPELLVQILAQLKAFAVALKAPFHLVIGSDSTISLDGVILGKPRDDEDANDMLKALSGRSHAVLTGVALVDGRTGRANVRWVETVIRFHVLSPNAIDEYVATGEPLDKAGSYAIQGEGGRLVESIEGCYNNVVGFPLCEVASLLRDAGLNGIAVDACRLPDGRLCPQLRHGS